MLPPESRVTSPSAFDVRSELFNSDGLSLQLVRSGGQLLVSRSQLTVGFFLVTRVTRYCAHFIIKVASSPIQIRHAAVHLLTLPTGCHEVLTRQWAIISALSTSRSTIFCLRSVSPTLTTAVAAKCPSEDWLGTTCRLAVYVVKARFRLPRSEGLETVDQYRRCRR